MNLAKATDLLDDRYGLGEALGGCQRLDRLRRPADDHELIRDDDGFRALGDATRLPEDYVNAYYLEDLKRPVSVARVDGRLYAATRDLGVYEVNDTDGTINVRI